MEIEILRKFNLKIYIVFYYYYNNTFQILKNHL